MQFSLRLTGYGGYGIVTAARLLGLAYTQQGLHVLQTESHGAAARGESSTADLIVSSTPIYDIDFEHPDIYVILSASAFRKWCSPPSTIRATLILIESQLLQESDIRTILSEIKENNFNQIFQVYLQQIAEELGNVRYMGIAALGALANVDSRIPVASLERAIQSDAKLKRFAKANLKAFHAGMNLIERWIPSNS